MRTIVVILGAVALWLSSTGGIYTFYSTSSDGDLYNLHVSITTACASATVADTTDNDCYIGEGLVSIYSIHQAFLMFRITGIPEEETITAANINLWVISKGADCGNVLAYKIDDYTPLTVADWNPPSASILGVKSWSDLGTGGYSTITCGANLEKIEKNVTLYVWLDTEYMCVTPDPTNDQRVRIYLNNEVGQDKDPYLRITTTGGAERDVYGPWIFTNPNMNPLLRVIE